MKLSQVCNARRLRRLQSAAWRQSIPATLESQNPRDLTRIETISRRRKDRLRYDVSLGRRMSASTDFGLIADGLLAASFSGIERRELWEYGTRTSRVERTVRFVH